MFKPKYYWFMLILAIILEITGTALMKYFISTQGGIEGYLFMIFFIACSYFALSKAIIKIPISTAYAIWEGIGLIGTAFIAWLIFNETMSTLKIIALLVILSGLIMIKKGTTVTK